MMGQGVRYDAVPVFWTIQYLKRLDYIGHAKDWDDVVVHGDLEKPEFLAYYVKDGRVLAAAGLDRDKETAALIALFERRQDWTPEELGDSTVASSPRLGLSIAACLFRSLRRLGWQRNGVAKANRKRKVRKASPPVSPYVPGEPSAAGLAIPAAPPAYLLAGRPAAPRAG